ncbi:integrator complex subunit 14-like [Tubulanus polymorphus]|uniref:integrator complex subunit 14-like n=1 Tax=Tubulanus polymorphus TaxID=672921 RepID=UPI003DA5808D
MPTVILLDVSLSMSRKVSSDTGENLQRQHYAIHGINTFLDYLSISNKLEFVSLVVFSSLWEQVVGFTRDYESIKTALNKLEEYDKTAIVPALGGVTGLILDEWGSATACQVILITDGNPGTGQGSLQQTLHDYSKQTQTAVHTENVRVQFRKTSDFPLPMPFICKLNIVCIAGQNDSGLTDALPLYEKLIDINGYGGEVHLPDAISMKNIHSMFHKLGEKYYSPSYGTLKCGHLGSKIQIFPPPEEFKKERDFEYICRSISTDVEIFGFLDIADIASPPVISRHLILPVSPTAAKGKNGSENEEEEKDDGKTPSFTVLLHGSLKVEGMVALVTLGKDWYGVMFAWADSKKKSNLMLSMFEPGSDVIPWLGNLRHLAPISDFSDPPYGEEDNTTPFPVRQDRRSYAQNSTVWIRAAGLQADVQKILRHARKLPEKQQHFYRELNRLRRMALSLGFVELLDAMSAMLERECTLLPGTAHPDAALQLTHAANAVRSDTAKDITQNILPLRTNFSTDD